MRTTDFTDPWRTPETVVMHHGNSKSSLLWYPWVPLLAGNYRVVRMDARGFGRSTVPAPGYDWSLEGFALDLKRFLDALGLDRVHLIGETVGGTISLKFASLYPERLRSATICSSPYKFVGAQSYVENRDLVQREGVEPWVRKDAGRRLDPSQADPGHVEWYIQEMCKTSHHVVVETLTYLSTQDLSDILPGIAVPTLIMVSEQGHGEDPDRAEGMHQRMPSSRLVVLPGTSGFVQHSAPEKCAAVWREFVAGLGY